MPRNTSWNSSFCFLFNGVWPPCIPSVSTSWKRNKRYWLPNAFFNSKYGFLMLIKCFLKVKSIPNRHIILKNFLQQILSLSRFYTTVWYTEPDRVELFMKGSKRMKLHHPDTPPSDSIPPRMPTPQNPNSTHILKSTPALLRCFALERQFRRGYTSSQMSHM